jgi:hypothetical protein
MRGEPSQCESQPVAISLPATVPAGASKTAVMELEILHRSVLYYQVKSLLFIAVSFLA